MANRVSAIGTNVEMPRVLLVLFTIFAITAAALPASFAVIESPTNISTPSYEFNVIFYAFNVSTPPGGPNGGHWNNDDGSDTLYNILTDTNVSNDYFFLDIRDPGPSNVTAWRYLDGYINGTNATGTSINIPIRELATPEGLAYLNWSLTEYRKVSSATDKIAVVGYTSHDGGLAAIFLRMLSAQSTSELEARGISALKFFEVSGGSANIRALHYGWPAWTPDVPANLFRWNESDPAYATDTSTVSKLDFDYMYTNISGNNESLSNTTIIINAANQAFTKPSGPKGYDSYTVISPSELNTILNDADPSNDPFVIDTRPKADYDTAHIADATSSSQSGLDGQEVWTYWGGSLYFGDTVKNLQMFNYSEWNVIGCATGTSQIPLIALLNFLGYNATGLLYGNNLGWRDSGTPSGAGGMLNYPYYTPTFPTLWDDRNDAYWGSGETVTISSGDTWAGNQNLSIKVIYPNGTVASTTSIRADYPDLAGGSVLADIINASIYTISSSDPTGVYDINVSVDWGETYSAYDTFNVDTVPPSVTIDSPTNGTTYTASNNIWINVTAWDNIEGSASTLNVTAELDGTSNISLQNSSGKWWTNWTFSDGSHYVTIYANDSVGNMNATGVIYFTVDTTPPSVTIDSPTNQTYDTATVWINVSVWDNLEGSASTLNVTAELDGTVNNSLTNASNKWYYEWPGIGDGSHYITIYANDSAGNMNATGVIYFTVDTAPPNVTIDSPLNKTYNTTSTIWINVTAWDNIEGSASTLNVTAELDGATNISLQNSSGKWWTNWTFSDGSHYVTIYANDSVGNMNDTEVIYFTVDVFPPRNTSVQYEAFKLQNTSHYINITWVDDGSSVDSVWINYTNDTSTILYPDYNTSDEYTWIINETYEEIIYITAYANDSNAHESNISFSYEVTSKTKIVFTSPTDNSWWNTKNVTISGTTTRSANITYSVNGGPIQAAVNESSAFSNYTNDTPEDYDSIVQAPAINNVTVYVVNKDDATDNDTATRYFYVDTNYPKIGYNSDTTAAGNRSQNWIFVNVSINESNIDTITLEGISGNDTTWDGNDSTNYWWNKTSLADGEYTIRVYVNDFAGNANATASRTITLDTTAPVITIDSPANDTIPSNSIDLNYSIVENNLNWTGYSLDGGQNNTLTGNTTLLSLTNGQHYVTIYADDYAGNLNSTTRWFIVDTTPPNVTIDSPTNTTYAISDIWINVTAWDNVEGSASTLNVTAELDGAQNKSLSNLSNKWYYEWTIPDGSHYITIHANDSVGNMNATEVVYFTVDTTAPVITIDSPASIVSAGSEGTVDLTYSIVEINLDWTGYSLDGKANVTLSGNTTLPYLIDGQHNITIYANDTAGNANSTTKWFNVSSSSVEDRYENDSVDLPANESVRIGIPNNNWTLRIVTNVSLTGAINITFMTSRPSEATSAMTDLALSTYLKIDASDNIKGNLSYAMVELNYTDAEVSAASISEGTLRPYKWNGSEWVRLVESLSWVNDAGVNTTGKFVWANVTNFSVYGVGGELYVPPPAPRVTGGGGVLPPKKVLARAVLTTSEDWRYAMMAAGFAAANDYILIATPTHSIDLPTRNNIKWFDELIIIGDSFVISDGMEDEFVKLRRTLVPGFAKLNTTRVKGANFFGTAVQLVKRWKDPKGIIVVRGDVFADALVAGQLSAATDSPILFTMPGEIWPPALNTIKRLKLDVTIIGGEKAVSKKVEDAIKATGVNVKRVGGKDRYETAALVGGAYIKAAKEKGKDIDTITFLSGKKGDWASTLGFRSYVYNSTILYVKEVEGQSAVPTSTKNFIAAHPYISSASIVIKDGAKPKGYDDVDAYIRNMQFEVDSTVHTFIMDVDPDKKDYTLDTSTGGLSTTVSQIVIDSLGSSGVLSGPSAAGGGGGGGGGDGGGGC